MKHHPSRYAISRRRILAGAGATAAAVGFPAISRAQAQSIKIGILHPVTGPLAYSGTQSRAGAVMALEAINAAGGIKSLGGAKLEAVLADAQSKPEVGASEIDRLSEAGVAIVLGPYASGIALATTQAAARHGLPHVVDVGVADNIMDRGLPGIFRFGPGLGKVTEVAIDNLVTINDAAGKPAKTVMIVHEDAAFGSGMAKVLNDELPKRGFEILETISHPTPTRDFTNIVLKIKAAKPDVVIPSNYFNEYILFARTLLQQRVSPKAVYSVLGGAASNIKFVHENNDAAQYVMDCNHWYDPRKPQSQAFLQKVDAQKLDLTYEVMLNYACMTLIADAIEHAASDDRAKITAALAASTFAGHIMPYGPTRFVNGQNQGAQPVNTQVQDGDIKVIFPADFADAKPVYPVPA